MNSFSWRSAVGSLALASVVFLAGCRDGVIQPKEEPVRSASGLTATIGGRLWKTLEVPGQNPAYYAISSGINSRELTIIGFGTFEIEGNPDRLDRVTIDLPDVVAMGTIALGADARATYTTTTEPLAHFSTDAAHTGTVAITEYDRTRMLISGSFSFTGVADGQTLEVTGGQFVDVPLRN